MDEEHLKWFAIIVAIVVGVCFLPVAIWAIVERPSRSRLKDAVYATLSELGILFAWYAFIAVARPNEFWGVVSFIAPMCGCYLVAKKFDQL